MTSPAFSPAFDPAAFDSALYTLTTLPLSLSIGGGDVDLRRRVLIAGPSAVALSSPPATITRVRRITALPLSVAATGQPATLRAARRMAAQVAQVVTGRPAAAMLPFSPGAHPLKSTRKRVMLSAAARGASFRRAR